MEYRWSHSSLSLLAAIALIAGACSSAPGASPSSPSTPAPTAATSTAPSESTPPAPEMVKVTFRHSWVPDELYIPFAVAKELGYFTEEGIEFEEQIGDGGSTAVKLVANGDVMFGNGEAAHVIRALDRGVPIVAVATQLQISPGAVLTKKDSGLTKFTDLKGKTIAGSVTSSTYTFFKVALAKNGMTESDVTFLAVAPPADDVAFLEGKADGVTSFASGAGEFEEQGVAVNTISFLDAGVEAPSTVIFVSPFTLRDNPELVDRFLRAVLKGLRYAVDKPEEAVDLAVKSYPDLKRESLLARWRVGLGFTTSPVTDANGLGWFDGDAWATLLEVLKGAGEIKSEVDVTKGYTNEILERIPKDDR